MDLEGARQRFIEKAKEAEAGAANAPDEETKATWLKIAEQYWELAKLT